MTNNMDLLQLFELVDLKEEKPEEYERLMQGAVDIMVDIQNRMMEKFS